MSQHNVDIVRRIYGAWSRGDLEAFLDALDPQIEWRYADNFIYGQVNPVIGRDVLRTGSLKRIAVEWAGFDAIRGDILDAGEQIVVLGHYVGTYKATGKFMKAQLVHVWTLANDKVVRWRQCVDTKAFADAMQP